MTTKNTPTKTINPFHFEDLDPHRFEDLVRQLIYEYKNWQTIEATGRAGSDEGFDIRAWEKVQEIINQDEEEESVGIHPMDGHLWMVQCKREQKIGPTRVEKIIEDGVDIKNPPYGYILVAPVYFSKKSYDKFRKTLQTKGVTEFYLWGKAELEDMLYLPKNDRILFTFFGISFAVRRRSKTTEKKFVINNKNKLLRILSDGEHTQNLYASVLIRDVNDDYYPLKDRYPDFDNNPKWEEQVCFGFISQGLAFYLREYYAFLDDEKKEYDFTEAIDLVNRQKEMQLNENRDFDKRRLVGNFWQHLAKKNQVHYLIIGFLYFEDILIIDDKGDIQYDIPHIFVDAAKGFHSVYKTQEYIKVGKEEFPLNAKEYKRTKVFPKVFSPIKIGKVYTDKPIEWDANTLDRFNHYSNDIDLLDFDGRYKFLKIHDAVLVSGADSGSSGKVYIKITHIYKTSVKKYLEKHTAYFVRESMERQAGRKLEEDEQIVVLEFVRAHEWDFKK